jgi:hypothetical protein
MRKELEHIIASASKLKSDEKSCGAHVLVLELHGSVDAVPEEEA